MNVLQFPARLDINDAKVAAGLTRLLDDLAVYDAVNDAPLEAMPLAA